MSVQELAANVRALEPQALTEFAGWFEDYLAGQWEARLAADEAAGRLDHLAARADRDFEAGRCRPL